MDARQPETASLSQREDGPSPSLRQDRASGGRHVSWLLTAGALLLIAAGFLGLDRWFYEHVSLVLEPQDHFGRSFYAVTKPLWLAFRYGFGHVFGGLVIFAVVLVVQPGKWRAATAALVAVIVTALLANAAQGAIGRLRPNQPDSHIAFAPAFSQLFTKERVGFPSGEAATGFVLACVLAGLFPRWRAVFYLAGTLAAAARLVNGAHYLSDVVAGALFGMLVAKGILRCTRRPGT